MCKRTMYKRARIPMFLWERRACANSGAQAVFPRPRKNGLGTTRLIRIYVCPKSDFIALSRTGELSGAVYQSLFLCTIV